MMVKPFLNGLRELTVVDGVYRVYIVKLVYRSYYNLYGLTVVYRGYVEKLVDNL